MPGAFARRLDLAAVKFDQMLYQREAQTQAAAPLRACLISLSEEIEDVRQEFRRDAVAGVADDDSDVSFGAFGAQFDTAAGGGELDRV